MNWQKASGYNKRSKAEAANASSATRYIHARTPN